MSFKPLCRVTARPVSGSCLPGGCAGPLGSLRLQGQATAARGGGGAASWARPPGLTGPIACSCVDRASLPQLCHCRRAGPASQYGRRAVPKPVAFILGGVPRVPCSRAGPPSLPRFSQQALGSLLVLQPPFLREPFQGRRWNLILCVCDFTFSAMLTRTPDSEGEPGEPSSRFSSVMQVRAC